MCGDPKPLSEFPLRSNSPDGRRNSCCECDAAHSRDYRRRKRIQRTAHGRSKVLAADALGAVQEVVRQSFGGRWDRLLSALSRSIESGDVTERIEAIEATHRLLILSQAEQERIATSGSAEEFAQLLAGLGPEAIRRQISEDTACALIEALRCSVSTEKDV